MCCWDKITNNKCSGRTACTLGKPTKDIKSCADTVSELYSTVGKQVCPANMPNFYMDREKGEAGCTDSPLKPNYKGPVRQSSNKCRLYFSLDNDGNLDVQDVHLETLNLTKDDSCQLMKMKEITEQLYRYTLCAIFTPNT